jgi:hypothetical protein
MSKTININEDLHKKLKKYCKEKNLKINDFINDVIENNLSLPKKSLLPLILKDNKDEIYETLCCIEISPEYKNNLPKTLTLIRNTQDGTGFIGNYVQK